MKRIGWCALALVLSGCGSKPPAPDWEVSAHGALERYEQAYLTGNLRAAEAEFARARRDLSATGQHALVARAELTRCALQVASLVFESCAGFEPLRADAPAAERVYADYLLGQPVQADQLPKQHRSRAVASISDPLARLVAAGVAVRAGRGTPELLQLATDTASAQGWRRPLLAWLGAQLQFAETRGATEEAARLRRRIALASGQQ